jgi:response regulator of citrate/malate metabolism
MDGQKGVPGQTLHDKLKKDLENAPTSLQEIFTAEEIAKRYSYSLGHTRRVLNWLATHDKPPKLQRVDGAWRQGYRYIP